MRTAFKSFIGWTTLLPLLSSPVLLILLGTQGILISSEAPSTANVAPILFVIMVLLFVLTLFWVLGLYIFYIIHVVNNNQVEKDEKIKFIVAFLILSILGMLVYWYRFIRDKNTETVA